MKSKRLLVALCAFALVTGLLVLPFWNAAATSEALPPLAAIDFSRALWVSLFLMLAALGLPTPIRRLLRHLQRQYAAEVAFSGIRPVGTIAALPLLLALFLTSIHTAKAQVSLGLNTTVVSETPRLGEPFTITISYGVISNVASLQGAYILVDFPAGVELVSLSPTSHIAFPLKPGGGGPNPEIIMDPMDMKRKLKIYFIDPLPSGSAGDVVVSAVIPNNLACPMDDFDIASTGYVNDPMSPGNVLTFPGIPANINVVAQGDNNWQLDLVTSVTVCGTCPSYGGTITPVLFADPGWVPADYVNVVVTLPAAATNIVCMDCSSVDLINKTATYNLGVPNENNSNVSLNPVSNKLGLPAITFCLPGPAGTSYQACGNMTGEPKIACMNLPNLVDNPCVNLVAPLNPTSGVSCDRLRFSEKQEGSEGDLEIRFSNGGQTCLDSMKVDISIPVSIDVLEIPEPAYIHPGIDVLVLFMDNNGVTDTLGQYVTNSGGAFNAAALAAALASSGGTYFTKFSYIYRGTIFPGFAPSPFMNIRYKVRETTDQLGNPIVGANPRIPRGDLDDCSDGSNDQGYTCLYTEMDVTGYNGNGPSVYTCDRSEDQLVRTPPEGIHNPVKRVVGPTELRPGDTGKYQISFNNCSYASNNVSVFDILDPLFTFDPMKVTYSLGLTPLNAMQPGGNPLSVTTLMDGSTVLNWVWTNIPAPPPGETCSELYTITYEVGIPDGTPPDTIANCIIADWDEAGLGNHPNGDPIVDPSPAPPILGNSFEPYAPDTCNYDMIILAVAELESRKGVKGSCDATYPNNDFIYFDVNSNDPLNGVALAYPGGQYKYRFDLENTGNVPIRDLVIIDILPTVGDNAVSAPFPRGSQFSPSLVELIVLNPIFAGNVAVYYSTAGNPCLPELELQSGPYNPANCTQIPSWSTTPPADLSTVKSIKMEFINNFTLNFGETFSVELTMQVPAGTPQNLIGWNSFAYQGARADPAGINPVTGLPRRIPVAEPTKVGIKTDCNISKLTIGNYVWIDNNLDLVVNGTDGNGLQDSGEPGVNGVKAYLWQSMNNTKGDGDDTRIDSTYTAPDINGNDGYYLFSVLNPDPNKYYYVVFDIAPANLPAGTVPTTQNVGANGNDALDSDVDPVMFMTDMVGAYSGGAEDLTLDMGLIPGFICTVIPKVRVICNNKGTASPADDTYSYAIKVDRYVNGVLDNTMGSGTFGVNVDIQQIMPFDLIEDVDVQINLAYGVEHFIPMEVNMGEFGIAGFDDLYFRMFDTDDITCRATINRRRPATLSFQNVQAVNAPNVAISTCIDDGFGNLSYNLEGTLVIGNGELPTNAKVEIFFTEVNSGNIAHSQTFMVPGAPANIPFSFTNLKCDGDSYDIMARFIDMDPPMNEIMDPCNGLVRFNEPCWLDITDVQITDDCRTTGNYTITIKGTYYNAPGNMTIDITGASPFDDPAAKTLVLTTFADGTNVTLQTFTKVCDGQLHEVTAAFPGNSACSDLDSYEGPRDRDLGDLPNTFGTSLNVAPGAAFHLIFNDMYLGSCVDSELDGAPQAKAGVDGTPQATSGTGGDDATAVQFEPGEQFYHTCPNDDEDGVRFITPMVQGNQACIEVTATSTLGDAKLDMWVDFNGDGDLSDAGEKVVFVSNTVPSGTSTQQYCFTVPATATFPNQYTHIRVRLSTAGVSSPVGVAFDGEVEDYYLEFAKIGDFVWEDLNIDGEQDNGEPGIEGATVSISGTDILNNPYTASVQTSSNGMYMFNGLLPGTYTVTFATPTGFFPTKQDNLPGDDDKDSDADPTTGVASSTPIVLNGLDNVPHVDAGYWGYASIGDFVWKDRNADGIQDNTEPGIQNVKVTLTGTDFFGATVMLMDFTDIDGKYLFDDLVPGDYKLTFDTPTDHYTTTANNPTPGDTKDSDADPTMGGMTVVEQLLSREHNRDYDAGYFTPVAVGDFVWLDANQDGLQNIGMFGEVPLQGFELRLFTAAGQAVTDVNGLPVGPVFTLADGLYMFMNLRPGDYFIRVIPPVAPPVYAQTTSGGDPDNNTNNDSNGELISGNIQSQPITLLSDLEINDGDADDDKNPSVDFGFYEPVGLGNYVFMDNDDSGTFNAGDMAIPGVTVQLYAEGANYGVATPLATKVTNPNGYYYFDNLKAGNYVVYIPGSNFNAGQPLRNKESVPGAQTGDTDDDDNGQDTKVNGGIRSNVVSLAPNTAPTNESGSGGINSGSPAYTGLLDDDNVNETIDFGFRVEKVALGNYVYMDNDDSGTFNAGDMAIPNVTVWLYAAGADYGVDPALATDVTDANGYYYFDQLNAGQYVVYIPGTNFGAGQPLFNKESTPGEDTGDTDDDD
ncbi:MAG: hypothetical protein JNJ90_01345, partial [Saprospiraceae bacterium]|nr:hypothetical protein [Saprospiraceae bacterium]